ncbi:MAG: ABC transporter substrate-binding protein, partial [Eubacteriales bacterium]
MTAKRILSFIIAIFMTSALLAACTSAPEDTQTVRIGGLKGPTSMGLVKLMQDNEDGTSKNRYEFTMAAAADELTPKFIKGELDMIAVPANLASIIYKTTEGGVKLLAINTLGVLYIVEKGESITSVADLKGKTIYATGKGTAPEFGLRHILEENGLDPDKDVTMEWKSEPTEVVALLSNAESGVAMLPQPFVTVAQNSVEGLDIALDLTEQWDAVDSDSRMVTGVLIARKDFVEAHPTLVEAFLKEYKASTDYANTNVDDAAALVEKYNIVKAVIAKKALPYCNIV